jgi:protein-disulfide isomerase
VTEVKRNRLLLAVGALVAAVVIVVVVLIVVAPWQASDSKSSPPTGASGVFAGVPQRGDTLGNANAPVTITVFEDPQCPFCRTWSLDTLPTVVDRYVRTGRVKLVYRGIEIIGPNSVAGLVAIYAAGAQNKLWNLAEELYRRQGTENTDWINDALINKAAGASGVDRDALFVSSSSGAVAVAMTVARRSAVVDAVRGTPTFLIERPASPRRQLAVSALDPASFTAALDAALR